MHTANNECPSDEYDMKAYCKVIWKVFDLLLVKPQGLWSKYNILSSRFWQWFSCSAWSNLDLRKYTVLGRFCVWLGSTMKGWIKRSDHLWMLSYLPEIHDGRRLESEWCLTYGFVEASSGWVGSRIRQPWISHSEIWWSILRFELKLSGHLHDADIKTSSNVAYRKLHFLPSFAINPDWQQLVSLWLLRPHHLFFACVQFTLVNQLTHWPIVHLPS